ncbi:hypothetical protein B0H12DRAFT_1274042 [Mycena haematopus]|nr:hypothetical protein B0H12DRAFT_1274042 [Mycena haematopus]
MVELRKQIKQGSHGYRAEQSTSPLHVEEMNDLQSSGQGRDLKTKFVSIVMGCGSHSKRTQNDTAKQLAYVVARASRGHLNGMLSGVNGGHEKRSIRKKILDHRILHSSLMARCRRRDEAAIRCGEISKILLALGRIIDLTGSHELPPEKLKQRANQEIPRRKECWHVLTTNLTGREANRSTSRNGGSGNGQGKNSEVQFLANGVTRVQLSTISILWFIHFVNYYGKSTGDVLTESVCPPRKTNTGRAKVIGIEFG